MSSKQVCERCGKPATQVVETTCGEKQQVRLCDDCVKVVIKPGTNYQVKK